MWKSDSGEVGMQMQAQMMPAAGRWEPTGPATVRPGVGEAGEAEARWRGSLTFSPEELK